MGEWWPGRYFLAEHDNVWDLAPCLQEHHRCSQTQCGGITVGGLPHSPCNVVQGYDVDVVVSIPALGRVFGWSERGRRARRRQVSRVPMNLAGCRRQPQCLIRGLVHGDTGLVKLG